MTSRDLADVEDDALDEDGSDAGPSTLASSWAGLVESKPTGSPEDDRSRVVFVGPPSFAGDEALLFDSARERGGGVLPDEVILARLVVRFPEGSPDPRGVDPGLELRVFVDDPTTPRGGCGWPTWSAAAASGR